MKRLLVMAILLTACTPAQTAVFNDYQLSRGWPTFSQADATEIWCGTTPAQRVDWLGWDTVARLNAAGAGVACDISKTVVDVSIPPADIVPTSVVAVNEIRAAAGMPPLLGHAELVALARVWSGRMADQGRIFHATPGLGQGLNAPWRVLGENVGVGSSVAVVMDAMVESPLHYDLLVDRRYTHVGIGVVQRHGRYWVTVRFMEKG